METILKMKTGTPASVFASMSLGAAAGSGSAWWGENEIVAVILDWKHLMGQFTHASVLVNLSPYLCGYVRKFLDHM